MTSLSAQTIPLPGDGQVCAMIATDIAGFSSPRRDDETRRYMREQLYKILRESLEASGIPWDACRHEDQGDGILAVLPPSISADSMIDPFPTHLRARIRRHNHVSSEAGKMQLRAAMHVGPVDIDAHGLVSTDVTYLFRMLDARPLRKALDASSAELVVAISEWVHENMVLRHPTLADPALFTPLRARVKRTSVRGWLYVPGKDQ
jgi:hypothetical protein